MAEKKMVISVELDLTGAQNQMRAFVAANNNVTVPVASPVGATVPVGGLSGVPATGLGVSPTEQVAVAAAMNKAESLAEGYTPRVQAITAPASRGGGFFGAPHPGAIRALAFQGARELGDAATSIRNSESAAGFATTMEQAALIRAEGIERAAGGYFGNAVFGAFDAFGAGWTPSGVARQARENVAVRAAQDDIRSRQWDVRESTAYRTGYGYGGRTGAETARAETISARRIDELTRRGSDIQGRLNERSAGEWVTDWEEGGAFQKDGPLVLQGAARDVANADLRQNNEDLRNAKEQAKFDAQRRLEDVADSRRGVFAATQRANMIASGATARDVARFDLSTAGADRQVAAYRQRGMGGLMDEVGRTAAEGAALAYQNRYQDLADLSALGGMSNVFTLQAQGQAFQAGLLQTQNDVNAQVAAATKAGRPPEVIAAIKSAGAAQINAQVSGNARSIGLQLQSIGNSNTSIQSLLSNNPFGAQIAAIRGQRDEALGNISDNLPGAEAIRAGITANANLREQFAGLQNRRQHYDVNQSIDESERQLRYRNLGPNFRLDAALDRITTQANDDARNLRRQGFGEEASRRERLGGLELRSAANDFYRSIQFDEVSPTRTFGQFAIGDVDKKVADANRRIAYDKNDPQNTTSGGAPTSQQMGELITLMREFFNKNFRPRAS